MLWIIMKFSGSIHAKNHAKLLSDQLWPEVSISVPLYPLCIPLVARLLLSFHAVTTNILIILEVKATCYLQRKSPKSTTCLGQESWRQQQPRYCTWFGWWGCELDEVKRDGYSRSPVNAPGLVGEVVSWMRLRELDTAEAPLMHLAWLVRLWAGWG